VDPDDPDGPTYATPASYAAALQAAAAAVALVDAVLAAAAPLAGLSLCRPPGHHAAASSGPAGFCLVNSVAVAARHAQARHGARRVAILDWDVHVGNGTQDIFYDDPDVLLIDIHRDGVWPESSGALQDIGAGAGRGATINAPLPPGAGHAAALAALAQVVAPALRRFRPDLILVSAGFDAHWRDPLESLQFQSATYHALAAGVRRLAAELCGGRCVLVLEGGYDCEALAESVAEAARGLVGREAATAVLPPAGLPAPEPAAEVAAALLAVRRLHGLP
jgi:acetoin utilization deacetylase AcuC-like enzyme